MAPVLKTEAPMAGESRELRRLETLERNDGKEEIRWSFDEFEAENGTSSKYVSARKWYRADDGEFRPTKAGLTIRLSELDRVVTALQRVQRARDEKGTAQQPTRHRRPAQHRERLAGGPGAATDEELERDRGLF
jgi:hypothetical protein